MGIAKESIAQVRERADIVAEIGTRITLKKAGGSFIGLCPFHGEKSPSFSVSQSKQFFHCFGCGTHGDVIDFLVKHDGMLFQEAVKDLGERLSVKVEDDQDEQSMKRSLEHRQKSISLEDLCDKAAGQYQKQLADSPEAAAYAAGRGLSAETLALYGIGFARNSRKGLANAFSDYSTSGLLLESGLVLEDESEQKERFDRFRDRLMFPIRDTRGRCIGFGGRTINANAPNAPRYLNSPETPIFLKHRVLYGVHEARASIMREKIAYVTEGYMDVVMMAQYGITNAVAAMGTALSDDHARLLLRFSDRVCFIFDGDKAGKAAAWKSLRVVLPLLAPRQEFTFLTLPGGADPDEYLRAQGRDSFLDIAKAAPSLSQYMLTTLLATYGKDDKLITVESRTQFSVAAEELCALIPATNPLRDMLLQEVDRAVGRPVRQLAPPAAARPSAADRLRMGAGQPEGRVPRADWQRGASSYYGPAPVAPALNKSGLWERIAAAVVMAPEIAAPLADQLLALLDRESVAERVLIDVLELCENIPSKPDSHPPDQLQAASDLLGSAHKLITRQRMNEVSAELKQMRSTGEITEEEYISQMVQLSA